MSTWVNREMYPFKPNYVEVPAGRMHYVDEGRGETLLMVHGTPTWSFLYRHLIAGLKGTYRVVAPDHIGSGLSDKPTDYSYRLQDQARNLTTFIEALDLKDITLVVHDFGGAIGLSYALANPMNIRRIVVFNTWLWNMGAEPAAKVIPARVVGSKFGRFLYRHMNFEFGLLIPSVYADRSKFTPAVRSQYEEAFDSPLGIDIAWYYAREMLAAGDWYDELWSRREALRDIPALIVWGMKDSLLTPDFLDRWETVFANAETMRVEDSGHFVQEEQPAKAVSAISDFISKATGS